MPNFNGAIIMHAMELINSPATLREIVMTIAQNTELPAEDIKVPVKQTLEMGLRSGFLQKAEGRYYLEPISFTHLMKEMRALKTSDVVEKPTKGDKSFKASSKTVIQKISSREAIKNPKPIPKKPLNEGNTKPKRPLNDGTLINPKLVPRMPLLDDNNPTSDLKKKSVTSLANKPRRVNNKQQ